MNTPFSIWKRLGSVAKTSAEVGTQALWEYLFSPEIDHKDAADKIQKTLGKLKGPLMKIAQMLGNIPGAIPEAYREAFQQLQAHAPPMGPFLVQRRMQQELGPEYATHFHSFDSIAFRAASLGQVHRAILNDGNQVVCKLQYPNMPEAVASDIKQFRGFAKAYGLYSKALHVGALIEEIEARLQEELDYQKEAQHMEWFRRIYTQLPGDLPPPRISSVYTSVSTSKLLVMDYLEGSPLVELDPSIDVHALGLHLFQYWYFPFYSHGIVHGDPHMGNYTVQPDGSLNILDFGCARIFSPSFVQGVVHLYRGLLKANRNICAEAFEMWGFQNLNGVLIDILLTWATFLYGPLLEDRIRPIEEQYSSTQGRKLAQEIAQQLHKQGGVAPPREFVFLDRATVGIGGALMILRAENNWHQAFEHLLSIANPHTILDKQKQLGIIT